MVTPDKFLKTSKSFKTGHQGFCKMASVAKDDTNDNIGFWFKVIENSWKLVLSVQYDSILADEKEKTLVITGEDDLQAFLENARMWAEDELKSMLTDDSDKEKDENQVTL